MGFAVLTLASLSASFAASSTSTIDLLYGYYKAAGGRAQLEQLKSLKVSGNVDAYIKSQDGKTQTIVQSFELWLAQPHLVRFNIRSNDSELVRGWDGHFSWIVVPTEGGNREATLAPSETHEGLIYMASLFDNLYALEKKGFSFSAGSDEAIDGVSYRVLNFRHEGQGLRGVFLLDPKTNLPKFVRVYPRMAGKEHIGFAVLDDWKPVDGVLYPHKVKYSEDGADQFVMSVSAVRPNVTAPNFYFIMPGRDLQWLELEKARKKAAKADAR